MAEYKRGAVEIILGFIILIFAYWQTGSSQWVIIAAAVILILHALFGKRNSQQTGNRKQ